ncbi:ras-related protein Rab-34 [Ixodes scapularis]
MGTPCVFCHEVYDANYKATIGVDFEVEKFSVLHVPFSLQIWDTAGQERFRSITSAYYRGAQVVILVFDLSLASSLYNTPKWLEETLESNGGHDPLRFLVGTKKDLVSDGVLDGMEEDATKIARRLDAEYWSVSAKSVVILVFDLSLASSLYNTPKWLEETLESNGGHDPLRFLVGTKKDLVSDGVLDGMEEDATKIARRLDAEYWSVSAKSGENVRQLFFRVSALSFVKCLTRELQEKVTEGPVSGEFVRLRKRKHGKKLKAPKCSGKQSCSK